MFDVSRLVLRIALRSTLALPIVLGSAAGLTEVAWAADAPFPASGLVEIVPPAALAADAGPVDIAVIAWNADGTALSGLKLKPDASSGTTGALREIGPGAYTFTWTPASGSAVEVTFGVKGKAPGGNVSSSVTVPMPAAGLPLAISSNPGTVTLGASAESTLSIIASGDPVVRVTSGDVRTLTNMGGGKYTAKYVGPTVPFPHLAVVTIADRSDPSDVGAYAVIPLQGAINFPVAAAAGSTVVLRIAGKEFGPVQLDGNGQGTVPVVVPPGVQTGTQITVVNGQSTESPLDLKVPETRRIALFPLPAELPAGGATVPLRAVAVTPEGKPDGDAKVVFTATRGTVTAAKHTGNGVFTAEWTPPTDSAAVKIGATVTGSKVQVDEVDINLLPPRPGRVTISTDPTEIAPDTGSVKVTARVLGPDGKPLTGAPVELGGTVMLKGPISDQKNGDHTATVGVTAGSPARITAFARAPVSKNAPRHVVILADGRVADDGQATSKLLVMATDAYGYPVANQTVALTLVSGGGQLSAASVTTDANGVGRAEYTAGRVAALVRIRGAVGSANGWGSLQQVPATAARIEIPQSGGAASAVARSWAAAAPSVTLPSRGAAPVALAVAPGLAAAGATPNMIDVTVPSSSPAGVDVLVTARPLDATGKAIPGTSLDFLTSIGSFGPVTEKDGLYSATLTLPKGTTGTAKVSVMSESGVAALAKIDVGGAGAPVAVVAPAAAAGSPWGGAPPAPAPAPAPVADAVAATPEPTPVPGAEPAPVAAAPEPKVPRTPKEAGDHPFLRARANGTAAQYSYEQRPSEEPGELLPVPLTVGGGNGGAAGAVGFDVDGRVWIPAVRYLGFHGKVRTAWYSIDNASFSQKASDLLSDIRLDVNGRFPFDAGDDMFWVGAKAGVRYSDFLLFRGCLTAGCAIEYSQVRLPGLGIGPEIGAEVGKLHFIGAYEVALANATTPYASAIDGEIGYAFVDNLYADVGFAWSSRKIVLQSEDTGEDRGSLSDQQLMVQLGLGVEF